MKMPLTHADLLLTIAKGDTGATAGGGYITGKTA